MKKIVNGEFLDMTIEEIAELVSLQNTPAPAVYPPLQKATFWLAALDLGVKKSDVQEKIVLIEDEYEREQMRILLEENETYRRDSPMVVMFAAVLGVPEEQINSMWLWAANQ